jgi:hypothetical protein
VNALNSWLFARVRHASPLPLALLRIAVGLIVLFSSEPQMALDLARGSPNLWFPPHGLSALRPLFGWLAPHVPVVVMVLRASAILTVLGLWTRWSLFALIASFLVLFGGAQFTGTVLHDMHLLWFLLLLWVSPCDQAWSLDGWQRGQLRVGNASREAWLGIAVARVLLGLVYLFPGLHKLKTSGLAWAFSDNLRNQLHLKWFQAGGSIPWPRIDQYPELLRAGGALVLVFEISFVFLIFFRHGRRIAAIGGLLFHFFTQYFLYIPFMSLWLCYVVLLDFSPRESYPMSPPPGGKRNRRLIATGVVGGLLVVAVAVQGARGETQSWPFACYPTFEHVAPDTISDLAVEVQHRDGTQQVLREPFARPQHTWGTVWRLLGLYGESASRASLQAFAKKLAQRQHVSLEASQLRFYAERYAIAPESYDAPPLFRRHIGGPIPAGF